MNYSVSLSRQPHFHLCQSHLNEWFLHFLFWADPRVEFSYCRSQPPLRSLSFFVLNTHHSLTFFPALYKNQHHPYILHDQQKLFALPRPLIVRKREFENPSC